MFLRRYRTSLLIGATQSHLSNPSDNRSISTASTLWSKYYDSLGITPSATQSDIKAAYYKLSMLYHPDKNKGSEMAAKKFREITEAYEVLGNFRTRKLYDKGIIHTAGPQFADRQENYEEPEEDDPQTKFYKAHMKKSKVPHAEGRTPIYDFDEWSRAHYGSAFERRQQAKERFERQEKRKIGHALQLKAELLVFLLGIVAVGIGSVFWQEASYDSNKIVRNVDKKNDKS